MLGFFQFSDKAASCAYSDIRQSCLDENAFLCDWHNFSYIQLQDHDFIWNKDNSWPMWDFCFIFTNFYVKDNGLLKCKQNVIVQWSYSALDSIN